MIIDQIVFQNTLSVKFVPLIGRNRLGFQLAFGSGIPDDIYRRRPTSFTLSLRNDVSGGEYTEMQDCQCQKKNLPQHNNLYKSTKAYGECQSVRRMSRHVYIYTVSSVSSPAPPAGYRR